MPYQLTPTPCDSKNFFMLSSTQSWKTVCPGRLTEETG